MRNACEEGDSLDIIAELREIVGSDHVSTSDAVRMSYAYNCFLGKDVVMKPDVVAMPQTVEQISGILKAANKYKVPVTPKGAVGGAGHGGSLRGGILLDLALMDKIWLVDPVNMKAVADAGCSFFKLAQELFKQGMFLPTAAYGPGPSVAASAISPANGFGETRYGANINLVEGFEVVLASGEVVRVGSMAYYDTQMGPYYRYITGPDLVGLFTRSNGSLGIVTKVAYRCVRKPDVWSFHAYTWPLTRIESMTSALEQAVAGEVFDVHLVDRGRMRGYVSMLPGDGDLILIFVLGAKNRQELGGKEEFVRSFCESDGGTRVSGLAEHFHTEWPADFFPLGHAPRGPVPAKQPRRHLYIFDEEIYPTSWFPRCYLKRMELCQKNEIWTTAGYDGFVMAPQAISAQTTISLDDSDPDVVARYHACQKEFRDWFGMNGGTFQYRLPPLVPDFVWNNQPGAFRILNSIKAALDPNNILSPGTFELGGKE